MQGRPPTPTPLRAINGNPGKRAMPEGEVQAPVVVEEIDPPAHLDAFAAECWRTLQPQLGRYVGLTRLDLLGLELFCASYGRYRLALEALTMPVGNAPAAATKAATVEVIQTTYTTQGRNGRQIKTRPEYMQALEEVRLMKSIAAEYGLTPAARVRLKGVGQLGLPLGGDPLEQLNGKYQGGQSR